MTYLYSGAILRVDLTNRKITKEPTSSYASEFLGGRGINIKILYDGVPPEVKPLDPESVLLFGFGPMVGTPVPAPRTEVTAKSPINGFLGTNNFGGYFAPEVKFAGYDNIVITGKADKPVYLYIYNDQVEIRDASHLWGKDTYVTQEILRSELGPDVRTACIGPAGEHVVHFATIQHELGKAAGRTGMGGVMGSKNLKAIAVRGTKGVNVADQKKFLALAAQLNQEMKNHPGVQLRQRFGHSYKQDMEMLREAKGKEPRPVFASDLFFKHRPKIRRAGCFGCPTQCMDLYPVECYGGGSINCSLYVTPFYWVKNVDIELMLELSLMCQRNGIDNVDSMGIIAWLMEIYERGLITAQDTDGIPMEWGSREAIVGMLNKMINREGIGNVLADGFLPAIKRIGRGAEYANIIKGLTLYDVHTPEEIVPDKGQALGMAMSPRGDTMKVRAVSLETNELFELAMLFDYGAEHTLEHGELKKDGRGAQWLKQTIARLAKIAGSEKGLEPGVYEGKPEIVAYHEEALLIADCLGTCKNAGVWLNYPFTEKYQAELFSAGTGVETSVEKLFEFARRVRHLERAYSCREGMTRERDVLPERFMDTPIMEGPHKGVVLETSKFEVMKDRYYTIRGWDLATGIPARETLEKYGLGYVADGLEKRGKLPKKERAARKG